MVYTQTYVIVYNYVCLAESAFYIREKGSIYDISNVTMYTCHVHARFAARYTRDVIGNTIQEERTDRRSNTADGL